MHKGTGAQNKKKEKKKKEEKNSSSTKNRCQNRPFLREEEGGSDLKVAYTLDGSRQAPTSSREPLPRHLEARNEKMTRKSSWSIDSSPRLNEGFLTSPI